MADDENRHFSVTLPSSATDRLDAIARRRGSTRAALVREAVLSWIARQPAEPDYDSGLDADTEQ